MTDSLRVNELACGGFYEASMGLVRDTRLRILCGACQQSWLAGGLGVSDIAHCDCIYIRQKRNDSFLLDTLRNVIRIGCETIWKQIVLFVLRFVARLVKSLRVLSYLPRNKIECRFWNRMI